MWGTDMLTTTVAGRTWNFKKAVGRNAAAGNGFTQPYDVALGPEGVIYVLSRGAEGAGGGAHHSGVREASLHPS